MPRGTVAVANGDLLGSRTHKGWTTYRWSADEPMASYLTMAASGDYVLTRARTASGAAHRQRRRQGPVGRGSGEPARASLALQPEMIAYFSRPLRAVPVQLPGAVVDDDEDAGYALENQTRPIYAGAPDESTVAHELAHQWYGDSVTRQRWRDIWLNEGFATYAEWMWDAHRGGDSVQEQFDAAYARGGDGVRSGS